MRVPVRELFGNGLLFQLFRLVPRFWVPVLDRQQDGISDE